MINISKEAAERVASVFDAKASRHQGGTVAARFDTITADTIRAQAARIEQLEGELDDLEHEYNQHQEKISSEFEGECWAALRQIITDFGFDDWGNPDGVTAEYAQDYMRESNAAWASDQSRIEQLEAQLTTARNDALREAMGICDRRDVKFASSAADHIFSLIKEPTP